VKYAHPTFWKWGIVSPIQNAKKNSVNLVILVNYCIFSVQYYIFKQ